MKFRGNLFSSCTVSFHGQKCHTIGKSHKIQTTVHYRKELVVYNFLVIHTKVLDLYI